MPVGLLAIFLRILETDNNNNNWNEQKQAMLETFGPESCTEIPMTLEDIFIECTKPIQEVTI